MQNILKLYSRVLSQAAAEQDAETAAEAGNLLAERLPAFVQSADLEVQERVSLAHPCAKTALVDDALVCCRLAVCCSCSSMYRGCRRKVDQWTSWRLSSQGTLTLWLPKLSARFPCRKGQCPDWGNRLLRSLMLSHFEFVFCSLDLDQWINEPLSDSSEDEIQGANIFVPMADDHR